MTCPTCAAPIIPGEHPTITTPDGTVYHAPMWWREPLPPDAPEGTPPNEPVLLFPDCAPVPEPGEPAPPPAPEPLERWISLDSYQRRLEEAVPGILGRIQLEAAFRESDPPNIAGMRSQLRADILRFQTLDPAKGINLEDPDTRSALQRMALFGMTTTLIDTVVLR
jgi:hypothetical protein